MEVKKLEWKESPDGVYYELEFKTDKGKTFYFFYSRLGFMFMAETKIDNKPVDINTFWEELEKASKEAEDIKEKIALNSMAQHIKLWYVSNKDNLLKLKEEG